jgi:hypothetical protein
MLSNVKLDTSQEGSALLTWAFSEPSAIEGFEIEYRPPNGSWQLYNKLPSGSKEIKIPVQSNVIYYYRIKVLPKIEVVELSGEVKVGSIVIKLTIDKTGIEVVSIPFGTDKICVAGMPKIGAAPAEIKYTSDSWEDPFGHNLPATQKIYTPKAGYSVIDMLALKEGKAIGGWAGRKETLPAPAPSPVIEKVIIGINAALGWGPEDVKFLIQDFEGIRLEYGTNENIHTAIEDKFSKEKISVVIGNTSDSTPLSSINISSWVSSTLSQAKEISSLGVKCLEGGNEMYLKANGFDAKTYALMMMSLYDAIDSNGLTNNFKVGVSCVGDIAEHPSSPDATWLRALIVAQPRLAQRADFWIAHPYPPESGKITDTGWHGNCGPAAVQTMVTVAATLSVKNNVWALTEFGVQLKGPAYANNEQARQASITKEYLEKFLSIPQIKSIYGFQVHDTGEGSFGFVDTPTPPGPLPWKPRLVYGVWQELAQKYK